MRDQELVNAIRRLKVETGSLACMGCGHEHNCGVSGCAVMREAADRIANQSTHIAALQMEIEKLRGQLRHLEELAEADRAGRLVVLPCKVGDTLFRVFAGEILEHKVSNMRYLAIQERWDIDTIPFCSYVESSIGKTIFLTHEQAERALEAKSNA